MAGARNSMLVNALLLLASVCWADAYVVKLSDFTVHEINPAQYRIDDFTVVNFSVTLTNVGTSPSDGTAQNITIVLLALSLGSGGQNIGNTSVHLGNNGLMAGQTRNINQEVRVRILGSICRNESEELDLCAWVSNSDSQAVDCLELNKEIKDGDAGIINCPDIIPEATDEDKVPVAVQVVVPIVMLALLGILVFCLCRLCKKHGRDTDSTDGEHLNYLSQPRKSLAHIYEEISRRMANVHVPWRSSHTTEPDNHYQSSLQVGMGTDNDAYQTEIEVSGRSPDNESHYNSRLSLSEHGNGNETRVNPNARRQSQPNPYTLEDPSLIRRLSPNNDERTRLRVVIEGISGETNDDDDTSEEPEESPYARRLGGPESPRSTTVPYSDTPPFTPVMIVPLRTGGEEDMLGPNSLRNRAASVEMPLRNAPCVPPDSDPESDPPAIPHREEAHDPPAGLPPSPRSGPEADQIDPDYLVSNRLPDSAHHRKTKPRDLHPDPSLDPPDIPDEDKPAPPPRSRSKSNVTGDLNPDSAQTHDPDSKSDPDTNPDFDEGTPQLPLRRRSKPSPSPETSPVSAANPDPGSDLSGDTLTPLSSHDSDSSQTSNSSSDEESLPDSPPLRRPTPPLVRDSSPKLGQTPVDPVSVSDSVPIQKSQNVQTSEGKPTPPSKTVSSDGKPQKPKLAAKPKILSEKPALTPRPELPAKPAKPSKGKSKSDPGIPASKPPLRHKPPSISVFKPRQDSEDDMSYLPSVTPPSRDRSPNSIQPPVDRGIMNKAIRAVQQRASTVKAPKQAERDVAADSPDQGAAQAISPEDPDFMQAVFEVYLSLMYETSNGEEDYESAIKTEQNRLQVIKEPAMAPSTLRRRKSYAAQLEQRMKRKKIESGGVYVNLWNKRWEFNRRNLSVEREKPLGEGQFGKVYRATARGVEGEEGDTLVAVKELKDGSGTDEKNEFLKELAIHTIMKTHPHVVKLIGCCIRDEPICIITEYLSGGSLLSFLRKKPASKPNSDQKRHYIAKFGLHVARGMAHVSQMEIVHRDLAARNVLISEEEVCKVSDFGFARDIFHVGCYPRAPDVAPIRWFAPESILDNLFSTKTDVWAFGILLFEIATLGRVKPYTDSNNEEVRVQVAAGGHPTRPANCDKELYSIMDKCWQRKPDDRPSFSELVDIFEDVQKRYPDPTKVVDEVFDDDLLFNREDEEEAL